MKLGVARATEELADVNVGVEKEADALAGVKVGVDRAAGSMLAVDVGLALTDGCETNAWCVSCGGAVVKGDVPQTLEKACSVLCGCGCWKL